MRIEAVRSELVARLRERQGEIEQTVLTRVHAVSEESAGTDPEYAHGLRLAVAAAVEHGLRALERSEAGAPAIPAVLLAQARLAARAGISLDTVLRRYFAGYTLLGDFVIAEAQHAAGLRGPSLQRLLRSQAANFDQVVAAVSEEYARELKGRPVSAEQRRADRVRRLLAGELLDVSELGYDFEGWHLGLIAAGVGASEAVVELAPALDRRLLSVRQREEMVWAWLGSRREFGPMDLKRLLSHSWPDRVSLALGEPGQGITGWRVTHRQASAALPLALGGSETAVRYADVALLASIMRDDLLVASLQAIYLAPLAEARDGGAIARQTLRAYFGAERNVSSTAARLEVSRQAVGNRLRAIEERLGRRLSSCAAEVEVALRLSDQLPDRETPP